MPVYRVVVDVEAENESFVLSELAVGHGTVVRGPTQVKVARCYDCGAEVPDITAEYYCQDEIICSKCRVR